MSSADIGKDMTEIMAPSLPIRRPDLSQARLKRRYAAERRFRLYGIFAVLIAAGMLGLLLATIVGKGYGAFYRTDIRLEVTLDPSVIDPAGTKDPDAIMQADYTKLLRESLRQLFPGVTGRTDKRDLNALVSSGADTQIRKMVQADPSLIGQTVTVSVPIGPDFDMLAKGFISRDMPESARRVSDKQIGWYDALRQQDRIEHGFNWSFFTASDSREPELAGVAGSVVGTLMTMLVTLLLAFPLAVATAVYLEEFAPKNRWTDLIEVNINNLAAVPSIVFGLLGLAVFIGFFGLPRSAPLVGGMVLALHDAADHHHRHPRGAEGRAALDPRRRARHRRLAAADGDTSRAAAGHAGHPDRHDHRHGARAWARPRRC